MAYSLINNIIAIDIETRDSSIAKKNPSKFIRQAAVFDDSSTVFLPPKGCYYLSDSQIQAIRDILLQANIIVGHNIKDFDLKVIFDRDIPEEIQPKIYDTLDKVKALFPTRLSHALDTVHEADDDAQRAFELYEALEKAPINLHAIESFLKQERNISAEILELAKSIRVNERTLIVSPRYFWRDIKRVLNGIQFSCVGSNEEAPPATATTLIVAPSDLYRDESTKSDILLFNYQRACVLYPELSPILWPDKEYTYASLAAKYSPKEYSSRRHKGRASIIEQYINGGYFSVWRQMTQQSLHRSLQTACPSASIDCFHFTCEHDSSGNPLADKGIACYPLPEFASKDEALLENISILIRATKQGETPLLILENLDSLELLKKYSNDLEKTSNCHYIKAPANSSTRRVELSAFAQNKDFSFSASTLQSLLKEINTPLNTDIVVVLCYLETDFISAALGGNHPDAELVCLYLDLIHRRLCRLCGKGHTARLIITDSYFGKDSPYAKHIGIFQSKPALKRPSKRVHAIKRLTHITDNSDDIKERIKDFTKKEFLKGDQHLRDWQQISIDSIVGSNSPVILIKAPTGGGKSVVFQGPALYYHLNGKTDDEKQLSLVVTPLRALMADQVKKFKKKSYGHYVDYINNDTPDVERRRISERIRNRETALLYVAPERLRFESTAQIIQSLCRGGRKLRYIIFDEAHCISQFGADYRPDYLWAARWAADMLKHNPGLKVLLFSATVGKTSMRILKEIFGSRNILVTGDSNIQPFKTIVNIKLLHKVPDTRNEKERKEGINQEKVKALWNDFQHSLFAQHYRETINDYSPAGKALFFCYTRDNTGDYKEAFDKVSRHSLLTANYHAGKSDIEREQLLKKYSLPAPLRKKGKPLEALFSTSAFGMGMDIPNILYLAHLDLPFTIEDFVQEVGRAVRNVEHAQRVLGQEGKVTALVVYDENDIKRLKSPEKKAIFDKWKYDTKQYWQKAHKIYDSIFDSKLHTTKWAIQYESWRTDVQSILNLISCNGGPIKSGYILKDTLVFRLSDDDSMKYGGKLRLLIDYLSSIKDNNSYCGTKYSDLLSNTQLNFDNRFELQDTIRKGIRMGALAKTSQYINICHRFSKRTKKAKVREQELEVVIKSLNHTFDKASGKSLPSISRVKYLDSNTGKTRCVNKIKNRYSDIQQVCESIARYAYKKDGCYVYELLQFTDNSIPKLVAALLILVISLNVSLSNPPADLILINNPKNVPLSKTIPQKWVKYTGCLKERSERMINLIENHVNDPDDTLLKEAIKVYLSG